MGAFLIGLDPLFEKVDRPPTLLVVCPLAEATLGLDDLLGKADGPPRPFGVCMFPEAPRVFAGLFEELERFALPDILEALAESPCWLNGLFGKPDCLSCPFAG